MKPVVPPELHAIARWPAFPASATAAVVPNQISRGVEIKLFPPAGGHTLLDLYFCAALKCVSLENLPPDLNPDSVPDAHLDELCGMVWRIAISAIRTRPDLGPVPVAFPEKPL